MIYAFIKDNICINIAVFDSEDEIETFKLLCDDIVEIQESFGIGDGYKDGVWTKTVTTLNLDELKQEKTTQTRQQLSAFLEFNPLLYNNEFYSITQEKQALLTSAIAAYQLRVQAGIPATLKWNTTGDVCREFTIEEITGLVIAITDYVQPRVEKQQELEIQIKDCTTVEELDSIEIDYEVVE